MNMDYKYIEQLIERYWECQTTLLEEHILNAFFSGDDIPPHLAKYKEVFGVRSADENECLGKDFDERIMAVIHEDEVRNAPVRARRITLWQRVRPLYQAAAMVAIVLSISMAAQQSLDDRSQIPSASARQVEDPDAEYTLMPAGLQNSSATVDGVTSVDTLQNIIKQQ